jgi:hypothetical protein
MLLSYPLLLQLVALVQVRLFTSAQKKTFKLMEVWVLLGNLTAISITGDVANLLQT